MDIDAARAEVARHDQTWQRGEQEFQATESAIQNAEQALRQATDSVADLRARRTDTGSRLASLQQIQAAALGGDDEAMTAWLRDAGLGDAPKLAARIRVADGWQRAADRLLGGCLGALCVDAIAVADDALHRRPDGAVMLIADGARRDFDADDRAKLLDKIDAGASDLSGLLGGVYVAETYAEALAMQPSLSGRECAVTRDGALVGANWVSFPSASQLETGVLVREEEIHQLQENHAELEAQVAATEREIAAHESDLEAHQNAAKKQRETLAKLRAERTEKHAALGREEARWFSMTQRIDALETELGSLGGHLHADHGEMDKARELLAAEATRGRDLQARRDELLKARTRHQNTIASRRDELRQCGDEVHNYALHKQRLDADAQSTADGIARLQSQSQAAESQLAQLAAAHDDAGDPVGDEPRQTAIFVGGQSGNGRALIRRR